jgi:predicted metal-binding protein
VHSKQRFFNFFFAEKQPILIFKLRVNSLLSCHKNEKKEEKNEPSTCSRLRKSFYYIVSDSTKKNKVSLFDTSDQSQS